MRLFESMLVLLAVAALLVRLAERLHVPYPAMLALAGGAVAALPWTPRIDIDPRLALALFVAPAVMDTAFDLPPRELQRMWLPLTSLAVVLVLLTAVTVAILGVEWGGLPLAAALALGAIVAPPDAAAAAAVLQEFSLPRRMLAVLQGESLLNDATALLVFGAAVAAAVAPGSAWAATLPRLLIAVPGGALLGAAIGWCNVRLARQWAGRTVSIIVQFVVTFGTWIVAERLGLSSIMAVVALATVIAREIPARTSARDRINSYAVWAAVVFVLNVLAFLIMGLQARVIVETLQGPALWRDLRFVVAVLALVIGVRFGWVMLYGLTLRTFRPFFTRRFPSLIIPGRRTGILVSWCGMRGLVTLATAFALPDAFPGRDLIVLSAFTVVLGTLVLQGLTIRPLIALLRIDSDDSLRQEVSATRVALLDAALTELREAQGAAAQAVRAEYDAVKNFNEMDRGTARETQPSEHGALRLRAIGRQRQVLNEQRSRGRIDDDAYHVLEEELDRAELHSRAQIGDA